MLDAIRWDADLIHRYDQDGQRQACYPMPHQFDGHLGSFDLLHALRGSRQQGRALSLYLHLPFCADVCYPCHRNRVITNDRERALPYLERLEKEIEMVACHLDPGQFVEQLQVGGGTPTFLSHDELRRLMAHLHQHFNLREDEDSDFSIAIDPREANWATMGLLRELGFNRINIGMYDLDPDVQRAINRMQTLKQTQAVIEAARTLQFRTVHIEVGYGLPRQTPESFTRTLASIIALQPDRVSVSSYAHLPERYMAQRRIIASELPSQPDKLAMLHDAVESLTGAGYRYIGMDLFALPDDELAMAQEDGKLDRSVLGYTTHGHCDLIGLGVSAVSQIGDLYSQNNSDITLYQQSLEQRQLPTVSGLRCTHDEQIRQRVIRSLTCSFELSFGEIESAFGISFKAYFQDIWSSLERMDADGLIALKQDGITILPTGRLLAHRVCIPFERPMPPRTALQLSRAI